MHAGLFPVLLGGVLVCAAANPPSVFARQLPASSPSPTTLPGGASALEETHGDWRVICVPRPDGTHCAISQQLVDTKTRQRVVAIELTPADGERLTASLALPFGLRLAAGITLQIDDAQASAPYAFHTCVPAGCLVPIAMDAATTAALAAGTRLAIGATAAEGGSPVRFEISLTGLAGATARARALATAREPGL